MGNDIRQDSNFMSSLQNRTLTYRKLNKVNIKHQISKYQASQFTIVTPESEVPKSKDKAERTWADPIFGCDHPSITQINVCPQRLQLQTSWTGVILTRKRTFIRSKCLATVLERIVKFDRIPNTEYRIYSDFENSSNTKY